VGDEGPAEHGLGLGLGLLDRAGEPNAAFVAGIGLGKAALAAAAGVDLRLDDPKRSVKLTGGGLGILGAQHDAPVADRRAICAQQRLGLILVDIPGTIPLAAAFGISLHTEIGGETNFRAGAADRGKLRVYVITTFFPVITEMRDMDAEVSFSKRITMLGARR